MNPLTHPAVLEPSPTWPLLHDAIPIIYEDEEDDEMGTASYHAIATNILFNCVPKCLKAQPALQVFTDLNCYYRKGPTSPKTGARPNFASDIMIVHPNKRLPFRTVSYTIGQHGPAPKAVIEVLSERTEKRDRKEKLDIYRILAIDEYIIVDLTGDFLPEKLQLLQLQPNGKWLKKKDPDGGVTSKLGFRLIIDEDDPFGLFVIDASGKRIVRPHESEDYIGAEAEARRVAEEQARAEAEARRVAEEQARAEAEARRLAEEKVLALQKEIERMRKKKPKKEKP